MPDENNIKDFQEISVTDGDGVSVEVALRNVYRFYGYSNPDMYPQYEEIKNISHILNLIDEEFGLKKLWDYTNQITPTVDTNKVKNTEMRIQDVPILDK